ncbi:phosphotransferase domain-containing protein, partial [Formosa agariphila KMM 3901]
VSYTGKEERTTVDLGLLDPNNFRGWSGGSRSKITLSMEDATPGYLPGALPSGYWKLLLGIPNIRENVVSQYEALIFLESEPRVTEFLDTPINTKAGWYHGDLHMHTGNSDGKCLSQSGNKIPCPVYRTVEAAVNRDLDFIAVTEHNATSHANALRELQPAFDEILLVAGREITTFYGHANIFGPTGYIDFRMRDSSAAEATKWMDKVNKLGGIVSINHAGVPSGEDCMGCGWQIKDLPRATITAIEIINGGTLKKTGSSEITYQGWEQWYKMLNNGERITAIGGSDDHSGTADSEVLGSIGSPTTVVFMKELSAKGMIEGIRDGRVYIDIEGNKERFLDFKAKVNNNEAKMGEVLNVNSTKEIQLSVSVKGVDGASLEFVVDGEIESELIQRNNNIKENNHIVWRYDTKPNWILVKVRDKKGNLILVSNPIYFE